MSGPPMARLAGLVRTNPGLAALLAIVVIATFVLSFIAWQMRRGGASLRPIAFVAAFFATILVPQLAAQVAIAARWMADWNRAPAARGDMSDAMRLEVDEAALRATGDAFADPTLLFGADVGTALVRDARGVFGEALRDAQVAQTAFFPNGETVLVARFASADDAARATARYRTLLGAGATSSVVTLRRAAGDVVRVAWGGRALLAWTAADSSALERRVAASRAARFVAATVASAANASPSASGGAPWAPSLAFKLAFVAANLVLAVLVFFKGAAWASREPARGATPAVTAAELAARLRGANADDSPVVVTSGATPDELEVTWRWADARWLDLARAHGMRRTHRLLLRLDASARTVRVREYSSAFDASIGATRANVAWRRERGMIFWERQQGRVFGLQLDERGRPLPRLSSGFRFDVREMKAPLIATTTAAGWSWRPVMLEGPTWLRWATE